MRGRCPRLLAVLTVAACNGNTLPPGNSSDMSMADVAVPLICSNGFLDGDETDTDCGGFCAPCGTGRTCKGANDCTSHICVNRMCAAPICTDLVQNGDESDVDCGGSCMTKCAEGRHCGDGPDCQSLTCVNGLCGKSPCNDGVLDNMETDVDCGGSVCPQCGDGKMCSDGTDCVSTMCLNQRCKSNCPMGMGDCDGDPGNGCETNTNTDTQNCGRCGNVCPMMTPACSSGQCSVGVRVLVVHGDATSPQDVVNKLKATGAFVAVDAFDAGAVGQKTPDLATLQRHDVVLVYTTGGLHDSTALGDVLADYYDQGGRVVVAAQVLGSLPALGLGGRFGAIGNGYLLLSPGASTQQAASIGIRLEPQSPLLLDVKRFDAQYAVRSKGMVVNGGIVVAKWDSGDPFIIRGTVKGRNRVDLNCLPPSNDGAPGYWTGDGAALLRNALLYQ